MPKEKGGDKRRGDTEIYLKEKMLIAGVLGSGRAQLWTVV